MTVFNQYNNEVMKNLEEYDVEWHVRGIIDLFERGEWEERVDKVNVTTDFFNWHKKGDEYKATSSVVTKDLSEWFDEPKVKIEKLK